MNYVQSLSWMVWNDGMRLPSLYLYTVLELVTYECWTNLASQPWNQCARCVWFSWCVLDLTCCKFYSEVSYLGSFGRLVEIFPFSVAALPSSGDKIMLNSWNRFGTTLPFVFSSMDWEALVFILIKGLVELVIEPASPELVLVRQNDFLFFYLDEK